MKKNEAKNKTKNEAKNQSESNKETKSGKKKAIIAGSVSAGITTVVATITIVCLTRPNSPNETPKYTVNISSEFEGFQNSNLMVNKGTKIESLKSMIQSPVEGYEVSGFFQDAECKKPYLPGTVITEDMKVFIQFDLKRLTVTAYANTSKTQVLETIEVVYGNDATLQTPIEFNDEVGKHEFMGWVDSMGNPVSLTEIKVDTEVFANFVVTEYIEYEVGEISSHVTITKGSGETETAVATGDNLHYGDRVKIVYTSTTGYQMNTFDVIGAEAVFGAENWYTVTGELSVTYSEEKIAYFVGKLPTQIKIFDAKGNPIESDATLLYDDIITITYTPTLGYEMTKFEVFGANPVEELDADENKYKVCGNITVTYIEEAKQDVEYLDYEEYKDGYVVSGINNNTIENVIIPSTYQFKRVYGIKDGSIEQYFGAFLNNKNIKSVMVEEGVEEIGDLAFLNCTHLMSVTIPSSVKSIGYSAFDGCYMLSEVYNLSPLNITAGSSNYGYVGFYANGVYTSLKEPSKLVIREDDYVMYEDAENSKYYLVGYTGTEKKLTLPTTDYSYEIGNYAFNRRSDLISVIIPECVTGIGNYAFELCTGLNSVTLPSSLTRIGNSAFYCCYKLVEVYNLSSIDLTTSTFYQNGYAKYYAKDVYTSLNEPSKLVFRKDGYVMYEDAANSKFYLVGYTGEETNLVLPTTEYNYEIYGYAFVGRNNLVSVTIPSNVTSIGNYAFKGCTLSDITIPSNVNSIGSYAFAGCALTDITIQEGVTSIGNNAFEFCNGLTSITLPSSVSNIGTSVFYACRGLTSVTVSEENSVYTSKDKSNNEVNCVINRDSGELVAGLNTSTIPNDGSIKSIGVSAFAGCTKLTSITIPEGVTSIGDSAFNECSGLTKVILSEGVTSIGNKAFYDCRCLTSITAPSSVTSVGTDVFTGCYMLVEVYNLSSKNIGGTTVKDTYTSLNEPSKLVFREDGFVMYEDAANSKYYLVGYTGTDTNLVFPTTEYNYEINKNAFRECRSLVNITIPNCVTAIGDYAFGYCAGLTNISIPSSVTNIGRDAFYGCGRLIVNEDDNAIYLGNEENPYLVLVKAKDESVTEFQINENTKIIYSSAFSNFSNLSNVILPEGLTNIGYKAFEYCSGLTSITIPSSVTSIGDSAFSDCTGLTSVILSEGVESIGESSFSSCRKLTSITLPSSLTSIGKYAFYNCSMLVEVYNLSSLNIIAGDSNNGNVGYYAKDVYTSLNEPSKLVFREDGFVMYEDVANSKYYLVGYIGEETNLVLPTTEYNYEINKNAFNNRADITSVTISSSVNGIGAYAFNSCKNLTSVIIESSVVYKVVTGTSSSDGGLTSNVTIVKVLASVDDGTNTFLGDTTKYDKTTETIGETIYNVYTKK